MILVLLSSSFIQQICFRFCINFLNKKALISKLGRVKYFWLLKASWHFDRWPCSFLFWLFSFSFVLVLYVNKTVPEILKARDFKVFQLNLSTIICFLLILELLWNSQQCRLYCDITLLENDLFPSPIKKLFCMIRGSLKNYVKRERDNVG